MIDITLLRPSRAADADAYPQAKASSRSLPLCQAMDALERSPGFSLRDFMPSSLVIIWESLDETSPK